MAACSSEGASGPFVLGQLQVKVRLAAPPGNAPPGTSTAAAAAAAETTSQPVTALGGRAPAGAPGQGDPAAKDQSSGAGASSNSSSSSSSNSHYYVLSRFLISRMLTVTRIPHAKVGADRQVKSVRCGWHGWAACFFWMLHVRVFRAPWNSAGNGSVGQTGPNVEGCKWGWPHAITNWLGAASICGLRVDLPGLGQSMAPPPLRLAPLLLLPCMRRPPRSPWR